MSSTAAPVVSPTNPFGGTSGEASEDASFVIISAFIVFTMHTGFGLLESGMVSRRSQTNVITKTMIDMSLGGIAYWFLGYGFSYGPNSKSTNKMSGEGDFMVDIDIRGKHAVVYIKFFFQLAFALTATTIVSGAVAERINLKAYMIFVIVNTSLIYVFPCHWIWSEDGWLYHKALDFAGSDVVHMSGGAAALAGMLVLGARHGRYSTPNKCFAMSNPTNVIVGTFFLWWGWIGFNCGSQFKVSGNNWEVVGSVALVTMIGAMGGGAAAILLNLVLSRWRTNKQILDIGQFTAAILGGLVSITGPCNMIRPWEGLIIGSIGGGIALAFIKLLDKLKIDDPVGAFGVHWGAGLWGMVANGIFGNSSVAKSSGIFRSGTGELLFWNIIAAIVTTVWSFGCASIVFLVLKYTMGLRLTDEEEARGSDDVELDIGDNSEKQVEYTKLESQDLLSDER